MEKLAILISHDADGFSCSREVPAEADLEAILKTFEAIDAPEPDEILVVTPDLDCQAYYWKDWRGREWNPQEEAA